ncbi:MAG: nuclear transport factor 2 family protein [Clostridia bacterium]|nr:nuclear transport factor 2 family protein [Clostridia bacterium]
MEATLRRYFQAWIDQDASALEQTFARDVVYTECYGPEYLGLGQVKRWFADWQRRGRVLEWTIRRVLTRGNSVVAEWYFECEYDGVIDGFDGVTIADFDAQGKIVRLREFQSRTEHVYPYGDTR